MATILTTARARFEASRTLSCTNDPRLRGRHGHGFVVDVAAPEAVITGIAPADRIQPLGDALQQVVSPFNYADLDVLFADPADDVLVRWISQQLRDFPDARITLSPTPSRRLEWHAGGRPVSACRYAFEAAHFLPNVPVGHKCGRLHGHSFEILVRAADVDYTIIDRVWAPYAMLFAHQCLNELEGLSNPTSECLAQWLWQALINVLPTLLTVTVYETGRCGATYDGVQHSIWRAFTFDAAVQRSDTAHDDARRRIHGHTYRLRLHLTGPLDRHLGWALDFGEVQRLFAPVYDALDHHALATVPGLELQSTWAVADWIQRQSAAVLPALSRVDLEETAGAGVVLRRDDSVTFLV